MRKTALLVGISLASVACDGSGEADFDTEGDGSTESATTRITTTGPVSSADGGSGGDPPPPGTSCEMCIFGWCGAEAQACLGDDACSCWLGCTETMSDEQCAGLCGDPAGPLVDLYQCLLQFCADACASDDMPGTTTEAETGEETETGTGDGSETDTTGEGDSTGGGAESTETTR